MPTVSVVVPAYNYARYLGEALESVRSQTFGDWECLVIDDGSTDATEEVARGFAASDARFRYVRQEHSGQAAARNRGVDLAAGAFVQFLDADDFIAVEKLALQVELLSRAREIDVAVSAYRPFDSSTGEILAPFFDSVPSGDPLDDFLFGWERGICIPVHSALFRREIWGERPPFDVHLNAQEDWLMWIDLALSGRRLRHHSEVLAYYRLHDANLHRRGPSRYLAMLGVAQRVAPRLDESRRWAFLERTHGYVTEFVAAECHLAEKAAFERGVRFGGATPPREETVSRSRGGLAGCTIVARNFASHARVLAASWCEQHPESDFFVLFADGVPDPPSLPDGVTALDARELAVPHFFEMSARYEVIELCTALKPHLLDHLIAIRGAERVVFLDPDIRLFRPLTEAMAALDSADVVLTPQALSPPPLDGRRPDESDFLTGGAYNLGFFAVRRGRDVETLLRWQKERFRDRCRVATTEGLFVDQKWADLIPAYLPATAILRAPGYNVAYWNLHERALTEGPEGILVNGQPLVFFHFSGLDLESGQFFERHQNRTTIEASTPLGRLVAGYRALQARHGWSATSKTPWRFDTFSDGMPWNRVFRFLYLELPERERERLGDPFEVGRSPSFRDWALSPGPSGFAPFLLAAYRMRPDVVRAFPEIDGADREEFLEWARTFGARELDYQPELVNAARGVDPR